MDFQLNSSSKKNVREIVDFVCETSGNDAAPF
jgi:hypothetical protein